MPKSSQPFTLNEIEHHFVLSGHYWNGDESTQTTAEETLCEWIDSLSSDHRDTLAQAVQKLESGATLSHDEEVAFNGFRIKENTICVKVMNKAGYIGFPDKTGVSIKLVQSDQESRIKDSLISRSEHEV